MVFLTFGASPSHSRLSVMCRGFANDTTYTLTPESDNRLRYPTPSFL
jgi:hypothetical protein